MLNLYSIDKKVKKLEEEKKLVQKKEKWENWKGRNYLTWLKNYKQRLEKFVIDVDDNVEDYDELLKKDKENQFLCLRKYPNVECIGPSRFDFRIHKTEKERINVI